MNSGDWINGLHDAVWEGDEDEASCLACGETMPLAAMPEHLASVHEIVECWPDGEPVVIGDADDLFRSA